MGKDPRVSKTMWVNAILFIIGIVAYCSTAPLIADNFPAIAAILLTVEPILNIILRTVTKEPLTMFRG